MLRRDDDQSNSIHFLFGAQKDRTRRVDALLFSIHTLPYGTRALVEDVTNFLLVPSSVYPVFNRRTDGRTDGRTGPSHVSARCRSSASRRFQSVHRFVPSESLDSEFELKARSITESHGKPQAMAYLLLVFPYHDIQSTITSHACISTNAITLFPARYTTYSLITNHVYQLLIASP